jgi:hypothetical protein
MWQTADCRKKLLSGKVVTEDPVVLANCRPAVRYHLSQAGFQVGSYSIVLAGLYDPSKIENVKFARRYADDVVVSTWDNRLAPVDVAALDALSVTIVTQPDPGSRHLTYRQSGIDKPQSLKRQVMAAQAGVASAAQEVVIRSRLDARLDYDRFHAVWSTSGRRFGAVNLTSICPRRLFSYPYLYQISDWCQIGRAADLLAGYVSTAIDEDRLARSEPLTCQDMTWHSRLAVEQVIALLLVQSDRIYDLEIRERLADYSAVEWQEHERLLSQFANVRQQDVDFRADKYRFLINRWLAWDDIHFGDDCLLKWNLVEFAYFMAGRVREKTMRLRRGKAGG